MTCAYESPMNSEEMEALSRKYSNDVVMLLVLSTGSIAVFNAARELQSICRSDDLRAHVSAVESVPVKVRPTAITKLEVDFTI